MRAIVSSNGAKLIYIKRSEVLDFLSTLAEEMKGKLGDIEEIYLFGSLARGEERGLSDVDLLVVIKGEINRSNFWSIYREIFNFIADRLPLDFDLIVVEKSRKGELLKKLGSYLLISKT